MSETTRILFLSANPWTTTRILVDEEAHEVFEKLQEGSFRDRFVLLTHAATRPSDVQRLLLMYRPHIVHFSGHGSKTKKLILGGIPGRGKQIDRRGLVEVLSLYRRHVRLVFLNACFTRLHARSLSEVIDYSIGSSKPIGDKEGVAFAGAFYRALAFGNSVKEAFDSATAEVALTDMKRARGLELFIRDGLSECDRFPYSNFGLTDEQPEASRCTSQLLSGHPDIPESDHSWLLRALTTQTTPSRTDLLRSFAVNRSGEVIRREQLVFFSYAQTTEHFFGPELLPPTLSPSITIHPRERERRKASVANGEIGTARRVIALTSATVGVEQPLTRKADARRGRTAKPNGAREPGHRKRRAGKRRNAA